MQSQSKLFEDLSRLMTNAMGVAQGAREEFETAFRSWFENFLREYNVVSREEFEAVRTMAVNAREENEALRTRIEQLEAASMASNSPGTAPGASASNMELEAPDSDSPAEPD